jgi:hypothetical protein
VKNKIRARDMCRGEEKIRTEFWWGKVKERGHFEDLGIYWR